MSIKEADHNQWLNSDIDKLEEELKNIKNEILAKKLLLDQLNKKPQVPFIEGGFARACAKAMVFTTKPFVSIYNDAMNMLDKPKEFQAGTLIIAVSNLIKKCETLAITEPNKQSNKMAIRAAKLDTKLSVFANLEGYELRIKELRDSLSFHINRMRLSEPLTIRQTILNDVMNSKEGD